MIPSLVRAAAPLARPVAKKMVPALSAAALATPTLMNADESERASPQAVAGDSSGAVTDATEGQTDAADAAPPPPSEGGRATATVASTASLVSAVGRSLVEIRLLLGRSIGRRWQGRKTRLV